MNYYHVKKSILTIEYISTFRQHSFKLTAWLDMILDFKYSDYRIQPLQGYSPLEVQAAYMILDFKYSDYRIQPLQGYSPLEV